MAISSGAKRDLLVLQFVTALLTISKTYEVFNDEDLKVRDVKADYHLNKRIDRATLKLQERMKSTIQHIIRREGFELSKWLKAHLESKVMPALKSIVAKTINLEMLALWVAFVCFSERDKALMPEFKEYANAEQYFRIIEMIGGTDVARLEGELFEEAYTVVAILKG